MDFFPARKVMNLYGKKSGLSKVGLNQKKAFHIRVRLFSGWEVALLL
jgi:hypothetical protein